MLDEGGLAGSVRPQNGDHIAALDVQVDAVQDLRSALVIEGDFLELDQRFILESDPCPGRGRRTC